MSGDNPLSVDHYHYFSHDHPIQSTDPIGVARVMGFKNGKYEGSYCFDDQNRRTAISEHLDGCGSWLNCLWCSITNTCKYDWETRKLQTVRVSISSIICKLK